MNLFTKSLRKRMLYTSKFDHVYFLLMIFCIMKQEQVWLQPQKALCMCGQEPRMDCYKTRGQICLFLIYYSFQGLLKYKCTPQYATIISLSVHSYNPKQSRNLFFDILFIFLTDRQIDGQTDRPTRGDLEAPSLELKNIHFKMI